MQKFNCRDALSVLVELESTEPPPREPRTAREFLQLHAERVSVLIERGWPEIEIIRRLSGVGLEISARSLRLAIKQIRPTKQRGRPRKNEEDR